MANIISKIKLSNNGDTKIYNIADKDDREALSDLSSTPFLTYKDNTHTEAQIKTLTQAKVGDFYIDSDTGTTWVCSSLINGTASSSSWTRAGTNADISRFVTAYDKTGGVVPTVPIPFEGHPIEDFVLKEEVINNLTSTKTNVPLSAYQGKKFK